MRHASSEDSMATRCFVRLFASVMLAFSTLYCRAQGPIGVAIEHDSTATITVRAGEPVRFDLAIRNQNLQIVENWDYVGRDINIVLNGSRAEGDSSLHSWSDDVDAYSWTRIKINDNAWMADSVIETAGLARLYYTIPRTAFTKGHAALTYTQSKADTGIVLSCSPRWTFLRQDSPPITIVPGPHAGYLIDVTSAIPDSDAVFVRRLFEIVVRPRDRYQNDLPELTVDTRFTARFPDEFVTNDPTATDIWTAAFPIRGWWNAFLLPGIRRSAAEDDTLQWIEAYDPDAPERNGRAYLDILDHAPYSFGLIVPADSAEIELWLYSKKVVFSWEDKYPRDPYHNVRVSRFDTTAAQADEVRYRVIFTDRASLTRSVAFDSDSNGYAAVLTTNHGQLYDLSIQIEGKPTHRLELVWYVEATDSLYRTTNPPQYQNLPGNRLTLLRIIDGVQQTAFASGFALETNYPNPFRPITMIPVETTSAGPVRLRVFNLLGEEVAVLHDGILHPGKHVFPFDGGLLPSGLYSYRLESGTTTLTRCMTLLR